MATFAFTDAVFTINSVDLSNDVTKITIEGKAEELDDTAMGDSWHSRLAGLKDGSVAIEFNQDFASSQVDATLWPLLGTVTTFTIKPTSASTSATNPVYSGSVLVSQYAPLGNSVGELAKVSVQFPTSGAISRATS